MEYVLFDLSAVKEMYNTIYYNIGTIFSIGLHIFILVLGVFTVINIVDRFGQ